VAVRVTGRVLNLVFLMDIDLARVLRPGLCFIVGRGAVSPSHVSITPRCLGWIS
jgi:hypothetical protein